MCAARMLGLTLLTVIMQTLLGGCQRTPVPMAPVTGKVAYRGYALPGGIIVFSPDSARGGSGPLALGKINQDGTYHLFTGDVQGATPGWYRVTVTSLAPSNVQSPGQQFNPPTSYLPDKYRDPGLSELGCEIQPNRANSIDFNLD